MTTRTARLRFARSTHRVGVAAAVGLAALAVGAPAQAATLQRAARPLPVGDAKLPETRTVTKIAPGVSRTTIVRGGTPAAAGTIATTPYGPWRINVVRIDPKVAKARLQTTFGGNLAVTEPTSTLSRWAKAVVGLNGGFFTFSRSRLYPGDPVGFMVHAGTVLSEPTGTAAEANVLIDAGSMRLRFGRYSWAADVKNPRTGKSLRLDAVNTALATPPGCESLTDPTACAAPGRTVRVTPQFARTTPAGPGVELVLDRKGCVTRSAARRGQRISATETSLQASGADAADLAALARRGDCLTNTQKVRDAGGALVALRADTYGVTGRFRLVTDGKITAPAGRTSLSARNPRSFIGRASNGAVVLGVIDGRSVKSVGATLVETAQVAQALGLTDAVNLDGGGSSTLTINSRVVNGVVTDGDDAVPGVARERAVSDAIVLIRR